MHKLQHYLLSSLLVLLMSCGSSNKTSIMTKTIKVHDTIYITDYQPKYQVLISANLEKYIISKNNFPSLNYNNRVRYLVLHYTAGDYETSLKTLTKKNVSSHYLVTDKPNDSIDVLVSEDKRAYHAGISHWENRDNLNDTSIGIEIVNLGNKKVKDSVIFMDFPLFQIQKVGELSKDIIRRYEIEPYNVIGHSDIAPDRKPDPGPKFPWKYLYDNYNIGAWYEESTKQNFMNTYDLENYPYNSISELQRAFSKYGYKIEETGFFDKQTKEVVIAFQMHFRPSKYDGEMDAETWAILRALNLKYKTN